MRNPMYEQALTKAGVEYDYVERVELDEINVKRGQMMQARLEPLDHDLIEEYAQMLKDGCDPPPLLLWKEHPRGHYIPLDGNQRIAAGQMFKRKAFWSAYVIKSEDQSVVDRLCWQFNNMVNGRRLSYEECMQHAITFVRKYNRPIAATAREWSVKVHDLDSRVICLNVRELAATKNIDLSKTPENTVLTLNALSKVGEDLVLKAAKVVAESGVSQEVVKSLTSDVARAKTVEAKKRLVDDFAKSDKVVQARASTKGGRVQTKPNRLPRHLLQKHLDQLEALFNEFELVAFKPVGKADRERYSGAALNVINELILTYGLGALLKGQGVKEGVA